MFVNKYILNEAIGIAKRQFDFNENVPDTFYVNFENRSGPVLNVLDLDTDEKIGENAFTSKFCLVLKLTTESRYWTDWELDLVETLRRNGYSVEKCES